MGHMKIRDDTRIKTDAFINTKNTHECRGIHSISSTQEDSRNISFDRKRELEVLMGVIKRAEIHEEPMPPLKAASNYEDDVKEILN
ncbi:hypothetical protein CWI37_1240p0010 [Hamiltosporidium tvaerminnensis]|uniref:Uncharacterized protein n=1 Tax=Hamiltosporidium tvaerminnensis TaxID=1176355 RepID=A0A4V2JUC8_9MICR|nr:hypothetical protein CWI37_1240p0010 [Hamiltosporidium tvaerminnensis]